MSICYFDGNSAYKYKPSSLHPLISSSEVSSPGDGGVPVLDRILSD